MLTHWITPLDTSVQSTYKSNGPSSLGNTCIFDPAQLPDKNFVAIIGWDPHAARMIRDTLYTFSDFSQNIRIADLGNFKKQTVDFALPALQELLDAGIPWILLGGPDSLLDLHLTLYEIREKPYSAVTLDEYPSHNLTFAQRRKLYLEELTCLGSQAHLNSGILHKKLSSEYLHTYRLGLLRKNLEHVEPVFRSCDLVHVNVSVMRKADAPAQSSLSTSGLFIEEACQLMRYAGFDNKLRTLSLAGWTPDHPGELDTVNVLAQMLWYYLEGLDSSCHQRSRLEEQMTEYLVHLDISDTNLSFYKDESFGTWWVKLSGKGYSGNNDLIPCSYQDYHAACQNMLSDRIFKIVRKEKVE